MVKKSVLAIVVLLLVTTNVWAAKTLDVKKTIHNLGSTNPAAPGPDPFPEYRASNEDEVCIFCHTPHGGTLDAPLWNRDLSLTYSGGSGTGFTHFTSATLAAFTSSDVSITNRQVNTESLLCLSCHDGSVAMGTIINVSNRTGAAPDVVPMFDEIFAGMGTMRVGDGGDLTDDHPVSFSYFDAYADPANTSKLRAVSVPKGAGIRFFGADISGEQRVECSSCHDPHVNGTPTGDTNYAPFLVMSNSGSALCLSCHIK